MKASDYRKAKAKGELTGKVTLPSGAEFVMRRPPLDLWIAAGKVPQSFLRAMLEAQAAGPGADAVLTPDETIDGLAFLAESVIYACVEPKVAINPTDKDTLDLSELDSDDFQFLTSWVQQGCPGVPVKTKGGEVTPENLSRFRQKRPGGGGAFSSGADGAEIREQAEQLNRITG